jgi:hypothetical protein
MLQDGPGLNDSDLAWLSVESPAALLIILINKVNHLFNTVNHVFNTSLEKITLLYRQKTAGDSTSTVIPRNLQVESPVFLMFLMSLSYLSS